MNTLVIMLLFMSCCYASPLLDSLQQEWETFKTTHNKAYKDETEENYRKKIFVEKLTNISQHNARYARGEVTFELGVNRFSDMTRQEVVDSMTGLKIETMKDLVTGSSQVENYFTIDPKVTVPDEFDWRKKDCVTPVKDQGQCRSSYAFSVVGAMECRNKRKTGRLVSLSEQNLIDCTGPYGNCGCGGGWMTNCYDYIRRNGGIDTEVAYPYQDGEGKCNYKPEGKGASLKAYVRVPSWDELALQIAVGVSGTVSVGIDVDHVSFHHYRSGIYYEPACSATDLQHAMLVVGYGRENGTQYWIVKNSWGPFWGENGYIRMVRNRGNNCGIATEATFPL